MHGALVGAAIGAAAGFIAAFISTHRDAVEDHSEDSLVYFFDTVGGACFGLVAGVIVAYAWK